VIVYGTLFDEAGLTVMRSFEVVIRLFSVKASQEYNLYETGTVICLLVSFTTSKETMTEEVAENVGIKLANK
jgi:hypothetical protein